MFFPSTFLAVGFIFPKDGRSFLKCWGLGCFSSRFGSCWCIFHSQFCLILLTHSKLGAVLLLLPTISCREPFHAQELGAVCVNFLSRLLICPGWTADFLVLELWLLLCWGIVVNSLESHFGHDRAKNDSGIVSLFKL